MSFNLPPGCSISAMDRAAGAEDEKCAECGDVYEACELDIDGNCEKCAEEKKKTEEKEWMEKYE